jgi:hypothetical protein
MAAETYYIPNELSAHTPEVTIADSTDDENFAGGENIANDLQAPQTGKTTQPRLDLQQKVARNAGRERYRVGVKSLKSLYEKADGHDGGAREARNAFLVGVATTVADQEFETKAFCKATGVKCNKSVQSNPLLGVILATLGHKCRGLAKKLASKYAIALAHAVVASGNLSNLQEYMQQNTIEECLRAARAAASLARGKPATTPAARRPGASHVPSLPDGVFDLTVEVRQGHWSIVRQSSAGPISSRGVDPVASLSPSDDVVEPPFAFGSGGIGDSGPSGVGGPVIDDSNPTDLGVGDQLIAEGVQPGV